MRAVLFATVCLPLAAQNITVQKQAAAGAQLAGVYENNTTPIASRSVQDYVDRIGARIVAQINAPFEYKFLAVIDNFGREFPQPIALPGGYIFVPAGLILKAKNEAEFAGVLAQAMARSLRPVRVRTGTIPLFLSDGPIIPSQALPQYRQVELEADQEAIRTWRAPDSIRRDC